MRLHMSPAAHQTWEDLFSLSKESWADDLRIRAFGFGNIQVAEFHSRKVRGVHKSLQNASFFGPMKLQVLMLGSLLVQRPQLGPKVPSNLPHSICPWPHGLSTVIPDHV